MPTFTYIAKKTDGTDLRGTLDAATPEAAREELRKRGVIVEDLQMSPVKPAPLPWSGATNGSAPRLVEEAASSAGYAPLHETLRIFAGWLLAWYGLIYALGFLEVTGKVPSLPFIHELFSSRLVLQFTFGTFLFLALSNLHRWLHRGVLTGFIAGIIGVALMTGFVLLG